MIDAGANIGAHTVWFSKAVGPGGRVIAFEPQDQIHNILRANLALNDIHNVDAFQACVGATPSSARMPVMVYSESNNYGGVSANAPLSGPSL